MERFWDHLGTIFVFLSNTICFVIFACILQQHVVNKNVQKHKKSQNNAATGDAVSVFFVLLPLGSIFGADVEGELAQVKGEVMALQGAVSINCKG